MTSPPFWNRRDVIILVIALGLIFLGLLPGN